MTRLTRRGTLAGLGTALATPSIVRAAGGEVTVWWTQGFYEQENKAIVDAMASWEKKTGTKVNLSIINGPDIITKLIAGMQVGRLAARGEAVMVVNIDDPMSRDLVDGLNGTAGFVASKD